MEHLRPVLGPCPCHTCGIVVTVYRVCYGKLISKVLVVHDYWGKHHCRTVKVA